VYWPEQLLGQDHPEVALVINNLATLLHEQHRDTEANTCYQRGPDHRRTYCCATLKITTGAAFTMPTTIPANQTARSVKCRPSSARCRERPVVLHSTTGLARSAWGGS